MAEHPRVDRFFFWLHRLNAIAIAVFLVIFLAMTVSAWLEYRNYESPYDDTQFGHDQPDQDSDYSGEEYKTRSGLVTGYFYGELPGNNLRQKSSGLTLVQTETGKELTILPVEGDEYLVSFHPIEDEDGNAVAFTARIATDQEYGDGISNLIVESFETLEQIQIAEAITHLDTRVLTRDGKVGLLYWPDHESAKLVSVSLSPLEVVEETSISLPPPISFSED